MLLYSVASMTQSFSTQQKKYERVRSAYSEKEKHVIELLEKKGIDNLNINIYIRALKQERLLELWAKKTNEKEYKLITEYKFCSHSGTLGPKRSQGDGQIPEGLYQIDRFNPYSNFYLSLGINYPNKSDRLKATNKNPGGDIFIHGNCVTIGCIPITDDKIKELYLFAVEAKSHGQSTIPVHIFPCRMSDDKMKELKKNDSLNYFFWESLKPAYDFFESKRIVPSFNINQKGDYSISTD